MPTLATGTWKAKPATATRGFTLLEIMVVLALIGIITSFAVLSVRHGSLDEQLQDEARRLAALIELNRDEAIMLNEQRGLQFDSNGYQFLRYSDDDEWIAIESNNASFQRRLADIIEVNLSVEGRPQVLSAEPEFPQILLLSSGETTEFSATFASEYATGFSVAGNAFGQLILNPVR